MGTSQWWLQNGTNFLRNDTFLQANWVITYKLTNNFSGQGQGLTRQPASLVRQKGGLRENNMFQSNKIILEVSSQLLHKDLATSVWILAGVTCLHLTQKWPVNWKRKQIKLHHSYCIKSTLAFVFFFCWVKTCFKISHHNRRARSAVACQNLKLTGQMSDDGREFIGSSVPLISVVQRMQSTLHWINHYPLDNAAWQQSTFEQLEPVCLAVN